MPVFSFLTFSNTDLGRPGTSISTGTFTVSGKPAVMDVRDNDGMLDDEANNGGQTLDTRQQVLENPFDGTYPSGRVVQSVYKYTVTNNTTGETGTAYLIRIYTGTNPRSPGSQAGEYYNAFDIKVTVGDSITLSNGNYIGQVAYSDLVICFTSGTRILTNRGPRAIDDLREGDLVTTRDNGVQPLRWIGRRTVPATGAAAPVRIARGALDNDADLLVSPNHRMLIEAAAADLWFAEREILVPAKFLTDWPGISHAPGGSVTYVHILFDRHEVVFANGAPSESFLPGPEALKTLCRHTQQEILALFPQLRVTAANDAPDDGPFAQTARLCLNRRETQVLHRLMV